MSIIYEPINVINTRLKDHYGFTAEKVKFRLTWPDNEFEIRNQNFTPEGIQLTHPKPQRVHKYVKYLHGFWVLERLMDVPVINLHNLPDNVLSYEPIYHFYEIDKNTRLYVPKQPAWMPIKFLVDSLLGNMNAAGVFTKYKHPKAGKSRKELIAEDQAEL